MDYDSRIRSVEDRMAILEVEGRYARAFDERDGRSWSSLFTPEGVYRSREPGSELSPGTFVQGTESLRAFCDTAPYTGIHLMHLPHISLDGDRATCRIHMEWTGSFGSPGSPLTRTVGDYDVAYVRVGSGAEWRIEDRVTTAFMSESRVVPGYAPGSGLEPRRTSHRTGRI